MASHEDQKLASAATNNFGFRFLGDALEADKKKKQVFLSPLSMQLCFSMVTGGASGETRRQLEAAFSLSADNNGLLTALHQLVTPSETASLRVCVANAIFQRGVQFSAAFESLFASFRGELHPLRTPAQVNQWCAEHTHRKITEVIDQVNEDDLLILVNAVYFEALFKTPFPVSDTKEGLFGPKKIKVKYMSLTGKHLSYTENDLVQMIQLPYQSTEYELSVVLPRSSSKSALSKIFGGKGLSTARWEKWQSSVSNRAGTLILPRFSIEWSCDLLESLARLGVRRAAGTKAEFPGFGGEVHIGQAIHKTYLKVDETGTVAAAVTAVRMSRNRAAVAPFRMDVNRPFFVAIVHRPTNANLFIGTITDPHE
eukprot:CAMPEP_0177632496 /NCGR_PEP_ID=MMETSP0447-20121125/2324_1 /TAXON_ID=0 /ORGANISM="Stygamoeba regulata, Strain BSH-02190019" /LENGTH=368 /DNA_ID=CAMNT_0019134071 /DNA_START=134 /DNA_END=1240 /DNA_ORIENTATION=-